MPIQVLLADDHALVRQCLRSLIEEQSNIKVVGEAEDGRKAFELVPELKPDIVIMDVSMPNLNGIEATHLIMKEFPQTKVIGLSGHSDLLHIGAMLRAGASGYVMKEYVSCVLIEAIMAVSRGGTYLCPKAKRMVVSDYIRLSSQDISNLMDSLSAREREILQLIAEGMSTKQIALRLHVSTKTIEANRRKIMEKLDVNTVPGLVKFAIREGITSLEW